MDDSLMTIAGEIVAAYVANNSVAVADLSSLIGDVHKALLKVSAPIEDATAEPLKPAVPVKKSVTGDFIICLEDGKQFRSLKRHLSTSYNLTPDEYRFKWGLPADYPMVAPNYAAERSRLAKESGLGNMRKKAALAAPLPPAKPTRTKRAAKK